MKKLFAPFVTAILIGAGIVTASNMTQVSVKAADTAGKITVSGMGAVNAKPDIAYISIGYTNQNADSKTAQSLNNAQMEKIIAAVKSLNIADKDIQTTQFSMYPQTDYNNNNRITGYSVTNMIRVTVRKLDQAGDVVDKAIDAGANAGGDIQFAIADPSPYYEQAMGLAIENANAKASAIADAIHVTIGKPSEITEMGSMYTPVLYGNANAVPMADRAGSGTPVQSGDLSVSANIQVVFQY